MGAINYTGHVRAKIINASNEAQSSEFKVMWLNFSRKDATVHLIIQSVTTISSYNFNEDK